MTSISAIAHRVRAFSTSMKGEFLIYSASTVFLQASKMLGSLIVAKLIGPEDYGWWNSIQPLLIYGAMLHFGVLNGMSRDVPYFSGKGDNTKADLVERVSWSIILISAILAATISLVGSFFFTDQTLRQLFQVFGPLLLFQLAYLFHNMRFIARIRFNTLSIQQFVFGFLFFVFSILFAWIWGLNGFILAQALANLIVSVYAYKLSPFELRPLYDWGEAFRLAKVGFPIMGAGFLYDTLRALDRWIILTYLGPTQVGYYTLAILVLQAITLLPSIITAQFYPRISKRFGETQSYAATYPLFIQTLKACSALILPFGLLIFVLIKPFTFSFLPEYVPGISAAMIITLGVTLSRPLAGTAATFLNAVGKAKWYLSIQAVVVVIQILTAIGAINLNWGLSGVAGSVAFTQVANMLMLLGLVIYLIRIKKSEPVAS
ncbi:MAG TPA: oligosaccharide flippase family protein [Anaerolineales bacterium]|nr:oligosaccharide flippase family protein [Anaerolineales bacterium]